MQDTLERRRPELFVARCQGRQHLYLNLGGQEARHKLCRIFMGDMVNVSLGLSCVSGVGGWMSSASLFVRGRTYVVFLFCIYYSDLGFQLGNCDGRKFGSSCSIAEVNAQR